MESLVRQIREAAGLNQVDFAREIGRSLGMVRQYEQGARPPADVIERLKTLAAKHHRADLGLALTSDDWHVRAVIQPGETLISQHRKPPMPKSAVVVAPAARQRLHAMLEEIFESGDPDAIGAVVPNIELFHKWVLARTLPHPVKKVK